MGAPSQEKENRGQQQVGKEIHSINAVFDKKNDTWREKVIRAKKVVSDRKTQAHRVRINS